MALDASQTPSLFCAAVIASAHGVQGHVKIKCFLEDPSHLKNYSPFSNENGEAIYTVKNVLSQNKDILIVTLEGITDRNAAELLNGAKLMLSRERLPELSEGIFYHNDLIGLSVEFPKGQLLGKVHAVHNFGAGELLEIETLKGDLQMIPFTEVTVPEVNAKKGTLLLSEEGEIFLKGGYDVS